MAPGSGEHARLFDITDEEAGAEAAAAADDSGQLEETAEGGDDGRRRRRRTATSTGAFSGRPAALVDDLTMPQRAAVEHRGGPLLIIAGAGSGKTRVLTRRIAHLLATGDAPPWGILAITFTNKAAGEMRQRVQALLPGKSLWISTFHSFGVRFLLKSSSWRTRPVACLLAVKTRFRASSEAGGRPSLSSNMLT